MSSTIQREDSREGKTESERLSAVMTRRVKNLTFFSEHFPDLYQSFYQYQLKHTELMVAADESMQIRYHGQPIYGEAIDIAADKEFAQFKTLTPDCGTSTAPQIGYSLITPPFLSPTYVLPRRFSKKAAGLIDQIRQRMQPALSENMLCDVIPSLVVLGCGHGLHIEALLSEYKVVSLLIAESDPDLFAVSLFIIDWATLLAPFINTVTRSVTFCIGGLDNEDARWRLLWNYLIEQCPSYPVLTHFYNHRGDALNHRLIERAQREHERFTIGWGNYDDELNQINQAFHNLHCGVSYLPPANEQILAHTLEIPICIVGAGPSLDQRIDCLKNLSGHAVIVSCGSSITALYAHGIKPDFHLELESDYLITVGYLDTIDDPAYFEGIIAVAPVHINPYVLSPFKQSYTFLKRESSMHALLSDRTDDSGHAPIVLEESGPTCTNLGLAFALKYRFKEIVLMGMDFGFPSLEAHHAKASVYYNERAHTCFKEATDYVNQSLFQIPSVCGGMIYTKTIYDSAKSRIEAALHAFYIQEEKKRKEVLGGVTVYNGSDGAVIAHTEHLTADQQKVQVDQWCQRDCSEAIRAFKTTLGEHAARSSEVNSGVETSESRGVDALVQRACEDLAHVCDKLTTVLAPPLCNRYDLTLRFNRLNNLLQSWVKDEYPHSYYMIRGSLRHFLHIGMSYTLRQRQASSAERAVYQLWQREVQAFIASLPDYTRQLLQKAYIMEEDPWLRTTITEDPESCSRSNVD